MIRLRKSCASPARVFLKRKFKLPIIVAYGNFSGIVWKENICYAVRMKTPLQISPAYCVDGAIAYDCSVSQAGLQYLDRYTSGIMLDTNKVFRAFFWQARTRTPRSRRASILEEPASLSNIGKLKNKMKESSLGCKLLQKMEPFNDIITSSEGKDEEGVCSLYNIHFRKSGA